MEQMKTITDYVEELATYRELLIEEGDYDTLRSFDENTNFMYCPDEQLPF